MASKKIKGLVVEVNGDATGLSKAIKAATTDMNSMKTAVSNVNKALKLDPTNVDLLAQKQKLLRKAIDESKDSLNQLKEYQRQLDEQGDDVKLTKGYTELQKKIAETEAELRRFRSELTELTPEAQKLQEQFAQFGKTLDSVSQKTRVMSAAATAALVASTKSAMEYEDSIAEIKKVVSDLTDETVADLYEVAKATATTNDAFSAIAEYASIGATLGIAEEHLSSFAKTMKDLETATSGAISGEEGAKMVARYLNIFNIGTDQVENFGSALTYVGDQFAATADEILETASGMSGLNVINGITETGLIGLAAEMKNLGIATQSGASAVSKSFLQIEKSVATGDKKLKVFAKTANMTSKEFSEAWANDPMEAFLKFTDGLKSSVFVEISEAVAGSTDELQGFADALNMSSQQFISEWDKDPNALFDRYITALGELSEESTSASVILSDVQLSGVRVAQTLLKLAGNSDEVRGAILDANTAWAQNTALTDKASKVYETTSSNLYQTLETVKQASAKIGEAMFPVLDDAADGLSDFAEKVADADPEVIKLTTGMLALTAAISPVTKVMGLGATGISKLISGYGKLKTMLLAVEGPLAAVGKMTASSIPVIGGVTLAVGATTAALALLWKQAQKNGDQNVQFIDTLQEEREAFLQVKEAASELYEESLLSLEMGTIYSASIDQMIQKLQSQTLTEEESLATKQQLSEEIRKLNETIGYTAVIYDEEKGQLTYLGEEVDSVTESYKKMQAEMKKSAWLEANKEAYTQAEKILADSKNKMSEAMQNFFDLESKAAEEAKELFNAYFIDQTITAEEYVNSLTTLAEKNQSAAEDVASLAMGYQNMNDALKEQQALYDDATNTIANYNSVIGAGAEEASTLIDTLNAGIDLDATFEELKQLETELLNQIDLAQKVAKQGLISPEVVDDYVKQLDIVRQQMAGTAEVIKKTNDGSLEELSNSIVQYAMDLMKGIKDVTFDGASQSSEQIAAEIEDMYGVQIPEAMIDSTKSALENIAEYWSEMKLTEKEVEVRVKYLTSGSTADGESLSSDVLEETTDFSFKLEGVNEALRNQPQLFDEAAGKVETFSQKLIPAKENAETLFETLAAGFSLESSLSQLQLFEEELTKQTDNARAQVEKGLLPEEKLREYEERLSSVQSLISKTVEAMREKNQNALRQSAESISLNVDELMEGIIRTTYTGVQKSNQQISDEITGMYEDEIPPSMIDPTNNALNKIRENWKNMVLATKDVTVRVNYLSTGSIPTGASNVNSYYSAQSQSSESGAQASGYSLARSSPDVNLYTQGNDALASQVAGSIAMMAKTVTNAQTAKEISQTNNQTNNVNVEFTVNNAGRDLTENDVQRYANDIVKVVNEKIGRMIG